MYRHGEILAPSHRSVTVQSLPVPTGPIIDIYPSFDRPQPKKPARRAPRPARPLPRLWLWLALAIAAIISAIIALRGQIVDAVPGDLSFATSRRALARMKGSESVRSGATMPPRSSDSA